MQQLGKRGWLEEVTENWWYLWKMCSSLTSDCSHRITTSAVLFLARELSCVSETTDQNRKSCSWSTHRGENFAFQLFPESKFCPWFPRNQRWPSLNFSETKGPLSIKVQCWSPLPSMAEFQGPPIKTCLSSTSTCLFHLTLNPQCLPQCLLGHLETRDTGRTFC